MVEFSLNATSSHYYEFDFILDLPAKLASFAYVRILCFSDTVSIHWLIFGLLTTTFTTKDTITYKQTLISLVVGLRSKIIKLMK